MKVLALSSLLALSVAAFGGPALGASLSKADANFLKGMQQDMLGQYAIGALGERKGHTSQVKSLAKSVASNALSADATLKKLAHSYGITASTKPTVRASYQYSNLSERSGSSFDRAFASRVAIDASIAADTCSSYAVHGSSAELRRFAKHQAAALNALAARAQKLHNATSS